jgi:hypothetical protein
MEGFPDGRSGNINLPGQTAFDQTIPGLNMVGKNFISEEVINLLPDGYRRLDYQIVGKIDHDRFLDESVYWGTVPQ